MRADASDGNETCQFDIAVPFAGAGWASWFKSSTVTFTRKSGSSCLDYLSSSTRVLKFHGTTPVVTPSQRCTADIIVLDDHAERMPGGHGFKPGASGTWFVSKLVFSDTGAEVYLNLDSTSGVGELSLKDEAYASDIVAKFASMFGGLTRDR